VKLGYLRYPSLISTWFPGITPPLTARAIGSGMVLGGPGVRMVGLGSKLSQDASERVGIEVERCGSPVQGRIKLETRESALIHINFDAGGSRAHGNIVTPCLWLEIDEAGSEWHRNTSKRVMFDAGTFPGGKRGDSRWFSEGEPKVCQIWPWVRRFAQFRAEIDAGCCGGPIRDGRSSGG